MPDFEVTYEKSSYLPLCPSRWVVAMVKIKNKKLPINIMLINTKLLSAVGEDAYESTSRYDATASRRSHTPPAAGRPPPRIPGWRSCSRPLQNQRDLNFSRGKQPETVTEQPYLWSWAWPHTFWATPRRWTPGSCSDRCPLWWPLWTPAEKQNFN